MARIQAGSAGMMLSCHSRREVVPGAARCRGWEAGLGPRLNSDSILITLGISSNFSGPQCLGVKTPAVMAPTPQHRGEMKQECGKHGPGTERLLNNGDLCLNVPRLKQ